MRYDIPGNLAIRLAYSTILHMSWICFPEWSLTYLAWIHTPLHYMRVIPLLTKLQIFSLAITHLFVYVFIKRFESNKLMFGDKWIPMVIGHIMTNE